MRPAATRSASTGVRVAFWTRQSFRRAEAVSGEAAAAFAIAQASTPLEFTDYYRAYLELAAKLAVLEKELARQADELKHEAVAEQQTVQSIQRTIAEDRKSLDEAERSVASSLGLPASTEPGPKQQ